MNVAGLSLIFLVAAIVIGYKRDINIGILAIIFSFALVLLGKLKMSMVLNAFPSSMFLTLLGTMYLFALLQDNGTLELLSRKLVSLVGKQGWLIPIIVYLISYFISAVGPGAISAQAIMIIFSVSLSVQLGIKPYMMSSMAILGTVGGTVSPVALTGVIVHDLTAKMTPPLNANTPLLISITIMNAICALVIYIIFKGYKLKMPEYKAGDNPSDFKAVSFNRDQIFSLIGMAILIVVVLAFQMNVGLVAFVIAVVLSLCNAVNEKMAFKLIPWGVLILVGGMSILMDVTYQVGGIQLLTDILKRIMNKTTAAFIMTLISGITGWFSSGNGVVIPTFVPTVPDLANALGGVSPIELIISIVAGATIGGLSPFDSGGSMIIGYYAQETGIKEKEQQSMFLVFFGLAVLCVFIAALVGLSGLYRLFI
ncbi:MatC_N domain-containing protein [Ruminococcaceae bacterium BL-6]|nr:MatC_N domain-containing protein [Ruminococcaceae bacterium BL-6]